MSTIFIVNLVVAALMALVTFKVEDAGAKGFLLLFLGSWFLVQILPSGCLGNLEPGAPRFFGDSQ